MSALMDARHLQRGLSTEERFERYLATSTTDEDGCILWSGSLHPSGYGRLWVGGRGGRFHQAHRLAYEFAHGPIPDGLHVDHTCHNGTGCADDANCKHRRCVNPAHLEAVTRRVNILRGQSPLAQRSRATHCKHGHEFTTTNTRHDRDGARCCRSCEQARSRTRVRNRSKEA